MDQFSKPLEDRKVERGFIFFGAIAAIGIGLIILIYFISKVSETHSLPSNGKVLNLISFGTFGDFIAGVVGTFFSLGGFFLLYLTLKDQRDNFHKERLESTYFELLKFHRDNINELQYTYADEGDLIKSDIEYQTAHSKKVFKIIYSQFKSCWNEVSKCFDYITAESIYNPNYLKKVNLLSTLELPELDFIQYAKIDIVYQIIYYGLSKDDQLIILNSCKEKYNESFLKSVLTYASLKPKADSIYWSKWEAINKLDLFSYQTFKAILEKRKDSSYSSPLLLDRYQINELNFYPDKYYKYYGGHQFRLSHYFRHLFYTVNFINNDKYLSYDEKYSYIKILRGQLSNYEQIVFFLNSLSSLGRDWELNLNYLESDNFVKKNKQLITKYALIKNITNKTLFESIDILKYYPNIDYENINNELGSAKREELINLYI